VDSTNWSTLTNATRKSPSRVGTLPQGFGLQNTGKRENGMRKGEKLCVKKDIQPSLTRISEVELQLSRSVNIKTYLQN